jgi:hypothetical protein
LLTANGPPFSNPRLSKPIVIQNNPNEEKGQDKGSHALLY